MHDSRNAALKGAASSAGSPAARREQDRRQFVERSLVDGPIPRVERRKTNHRHEDRFPGVVDRAALFFRRRKLLVRVVNVSGSGVMIESEIQPKIGEIVGLGFEGFAPLRAVVRWVRKGQIGLDVGEGAIDLA